MRSFLPSLLLLLWSISSTHAQLQELEYAAVRGWYKTCNDATVPCQTIEEFYDDDPLYLDFDTCYSNPNMNQTSITFLGRSSNLEPVFYNLFFTTDEGMTEFSPTDCDSRGACACTSPTELSGLRAAILEDPSQCQDFEGRYRCTTVPYNKEPTSCLVPTKVDLGTGGQEHLVCAMVADLALIPLAIGNETAPTMASTTVSNETAPSIAPATTPATSIAPTPVTAPADTEPKLTFSNVTIPASAQAAYCTAIVGWYDSCLDPGDNFDESFCEGATYTQLDAPVFLDLTTCYVNPKMPNQRSVSFFGETPDASRILEYHLIFTTETGDSSLKPTDCQPDGTCVCPDALVQLKADFLAAGGDCLDHPDYSCLSEDFYGSTETCFIPAMYEFGDPSASDVACNMVANLEQYGPCETMLDIPAPAYEAHCTAITGWYDKCLDNGDANDVCTGADFTPLDDVVFIDLESCYTNPNTHTGVSFYGRQSLESEILQFHILPSNATADKYKATCNDSITGKCLCSQTLIDLKSTFVAQGFCNSTDEYTCQYDTFEALDNGPKRCYVPATRMSDTDFTCSMVASIEAFFPCDVSLLEQPPPTSGNADDVVVDPLSVTIPANAHDAYCTAIVGWHNGCTETPEGVDFVECNGTVTTLATDPLFIDFDTCYVNPAIGDGAISMYGKDANGVVKGFHLIFLQETTALPYRPLVCEDNGACECSAPIKDLKAQFLAEGNCNITSDYLCTAQDFGGDTEDCYIPTFAEIPSTKSFKCTMAAQVQQFQPCNVQSPTSAPISAAPSRDMSGPVEPLPTNVHQIPKTAVDLGYTAITGWWDKCGDAGDTNQCADATQERFEKPIYLNLDTCYSNPNSFFRSVSFFHKAADNSQVYSYHLLFENSASWSTYKPSDCSNQGECTCESSPQLQAIRDALKQNPECQAGDGYTCTREVFSSYNANCYVPAQKQFVSGEAVCAMGASLEQIVPTSDFTNDGEEPGEAEFPTPGEGGTDTLGATANTASASNNSKTLDWWAVLLILVGAVIVLSLVTVFVARRRSRFGGSIHGGGSGHGEDVWIRTDNQRDSRFTRRPLNTDEPGDGVWKKEGTNIHDLKFTTVS